MPKTLDPRIELGLKRFKLCEEADAPVREPMIDDLKFVTGEQWDPELKRLRTAQKLPCLTINRQRQFLRQVTNNQRQNRVSAKVSPVDDKADIETAEVFQGIFRHIEYASNAKVAYDTAGLYSAATGRGYFRILTEYDDPKSFEQEIRIKRMPNPFMVYMDPSSKEPDGSDAKFVFIVEELMREEYESQYPDKKLSGLEDFTSYGDRSPDWLTKDGVRIAEYYYKDEKPETLVEITTPSGPSSFYKSELKDAEAYDKFKAAGLITRERDTASCQIKWLKFNAVEVLDETDIPGPWIPVVKVIGEEFDVNGKLVLSGVIRDSKDSQKMYNLNASAEATEIALAPKSKYIAAAGQIEKYQSEWAKANDPTQVVLRYDPVDAAGARVPPPQDIRREPQIGAISEARAAAAEDLKATTGIYDAALGNKSNEQSGRAIGARQQQSDTSNYHYVDNLTTSITHGARIILNWIPTYYSTRKMIRIIGEDDAPKVIKLAETLKKDGSTYDFSVGKYDVVCVPDKSFASKRKEGAETWVGLAQSFPPVMQLAGDLIVRSLDVPYANEVAERLKKALPPQLQDEQDGQQQIPPQVQQAISQLQQQNQQLSQALEHQNQLNEVEQRKADNQMALEDKKFGNAKELALIDRETNLMAIEAKIDAQAALDTMKAEIEQIHAELDAVRAKDSAEHAAGLQMDQAAHGSDLQMQQAEHAQSIAPEPAQQPSA